MNYTENLKLQKPLSTEKYSVQVTNTNMDLIDAAFKRTEEKNESQDQLLATKSQVESHQNDKGNPHNVTKAQVGLNQVINSRQISGNASGTSEGNVPLWGADGYTLKDSGYVLEQSVTKQSKLTDTVYTHPSGDGYYHLPAAGNSSNNKFLKAGSSPGEETWSDMTKKDVTDALGFVPMNSEPAVGDWAKQPNKPTYTKAEVGLGAVTNVRQIAGNASGTANNNVALWGTDGYTLKDSGYVLEQSVTKQSKLTDTVYTHPSSDGNLHLPATGTANNGKFLRAGNASGQTGWKDLTKKDVTDALGYDPANNDINIADWAKQPNKPTYTKAEVGLGNVDNTKDSQKNVASAVKATQDANGNVISSTYALKSSLGDAAKYSVVNNCTTTETGFLVDARQAYYLKDYADKINAGRLENFNYVNKRINDRLAEGSLIIKWEYINNSSHLRFYIGDTLVASLRQNTFL